MKKLNLSKIVLFAATVTLLLTPAYAGSFSVSPVRIELSAQRPNIVLQIANHSNEATTIQVQVVSWSYAGEKDLYTRTDEILLNPPIFILRPNQKQSMRLGLRRPAVGSTAEIAYRVILEEVPKPPPPGFSGLQTLLRISIPIFVRPSVPVSPKLLWQAHRTSEGSLVLSAVNQGNAHVQIRELQLSHREDAAPSFNRSLSEYLLPGQSRTWTFQVPELRDAARVLLVGKTDAGEVNEVLVPTVR